MVGVIIAPFAESGNKASSVVSVQMAFIGTLNLPSNFILTTFTSSIFFYVGQLLLLLLFTVT